MSKYYLILYLKHDTQQVRNKKIVKRKRVILVETHYWNGVTNKFCIECDLFQLGTWTHDKSFTLKTLTYFFFHVFKRYNIDKLTI